MRGMKVFVYDKRTNRRIATITDVEKVESMDDKTVLIYVRFVDNPFSFDAKISKITAYQN